MNIEKVYLSNYAFGKHIYVEHGGRFTNHPPHINDCYMAVYIAHGSGTCEINEETLELAEGNILLLAPDIQYSLRPIQGMHHIDIYFCLFSMEAVGVRASELKESFSYLGEFFSGEISFLYSIDNDNKEIRDIFIRMIDEQLSEYPSCYTALEGYLLILLTKILRNAKNTDMRKIYTKNHKVDMAIQYIHKMMYSRVSLRQIADYLRLSPSFLCRLFKENAGMTTSQYINMLRVDKIKDVLRNTDKPVDAVPDMFGCNSEYLKRVFKRETGMTMYEYRNKYHYKSLKND